jgi:cyclic pyranopterin phosphate synthase
VSDHICSNCNRLRLSSQGFLKLCLNFNVGLDLKEMLQNAADDDKIRKAVIDAVYNKPKRHTFGLDDGGIEGMSKIGG